MSAPGKKPKARNVADLLNAPKDKLKAEVENLRKENASLRRLAEDTAAELAKARKVKARKPQSVKPTKARKRGDVVEVILSDVHGNQHDPEAWRAFLGDLKSIDPDQVFIGGDFINCGGFLAEHHTIGYVAEMEDSYAEDVETANRLLDELQAHAPRARFDYLEGNHEWRVERWVCQQKLAHQKDVDLLRRAFAPETVLKLKERGFHYYSQGENHGDCQIMGWFHRNKLYYVHKLNNASNAADRALAQTSANVVFFDTHRADFKPAFKPGAGLFAAWNPGCLCQRQPMYANTRPTNWTHGYLVRHIIPASGNFTMANILIEDGVSLGGALMGRGER